MNIVQALLIALAANLASGRIWSPVTWPFCYPLINGTIVGIILGEPLLGMLAGATINLVYIGWISAGGTMPSNIGIAGVYGTALAILAHAEPELAVAFAIPIGLLGVLQFQLMMTINSVWVHRLDKNAENAELDKVWVNAALLPQLTAFLINGIPAFILMAVGGDFFVEMMGRIPENVVNALTVVGGLLPALGVAMLLKYLGKKNLIPFFILGFFLTTYLNLGIMPLAILGACVAVIYYFSSQKSNEAVEVSDELPEETPSVELTTRLTKADLRKHWLIGLGAEIGYNYERMQASGNLLAMVPVIRRLYKTKEDISSAMKRYLVFFNTEPSFVGTVIPGVAASLEEQKANGADISDEMITGLRTGLMGPLAGVGDSLAGGIIYPIGISLGVSLALTNHSFAGPVLFFVLFAGIMLLLGGSLYNMGYKRGGNSIMSILGEGSRSIVKLTDAFSVLGLLVIGGMGATRVIANTPVVINVGQTSVVLQDVLNGLVPNLLPFAIIIGIWYLLNKKVNPSWVVLILTALGFAAYFLGLLA
ncbi:MAG: PTS system mannose/fructose/sorbose family transporter subunit IID [Anaerolineaceae bacterium]|jgi:PTS system mannose-specific IID component